MYRGFAIVILFWASLSASPAPEKTPLQYATDRIVEMETQSRLADARIACDAAVPLTEDPAARQLDQAMLFSTCGNVYATADSDRSRLFLDRALTLWEKNLGPMHRQAGATNLDLASI